MKAFVIGVLVGVAWFILAVAVAVPVALLLRRARLEQTRPISSRHPAGSKVPRQSTAPAIEYPSDDPVWAELDAALREAANGAPVEHVGQTVFTGSVTGRTMRDRCGPDGKCFRHSEVRCSGPIPCCGTCPTDPAPGGVE